MKGRLAGAGVLVVGLVWVGGALRPARPRVVSSFDRPPPTEVLAGQEEGEEGEEGREEWLRLVHRAPPDVDWRAVEADNVRALVARRSAAGGRRAAPVGRWVERGSDNLAGSMYTVRRSADGAHLVAGASLGGVWRGGRDGSAWEPLGDNVFGGAHHVVVLPPDTPGDPDVLLTSPTWYDLVFRSDDDGATWTAPTGLDPDLYGIRRIVASRDGTVWLVGVKAQGLLYRSTDGGRTFERVLTLGAQGDVWVPRDGDDPGVYVLSQSSLIVSVDGGSTWDERPLPGVVTTGRIAGSEATSPPTLYATLDGWYGGYADVELYRSADLGESWDAVGVVADYWDVLTASIRDPNLVAYGGMDLHVSRDGGASFASPNTWDEYYADPEHKLHADMMAVTVEPDAGGAETWYVGCHGGVYESVDQLASVDNLSLVGLRVSQYYSVHTSATDRGSVLAGAQDQGLQLATAAPAEGDQPFAFEQIISGDYGHIVSTDGSHDDWVFTDYPGILLGWRPDGPMEWMYYPADPAIPPWLPFLAPDPKGKPDAFLFAASKLWRYHRTGPWQWEVEPLSDQSFLESPGEYLSAVAFSPIDPDLGVGVTSTGRVFRSTDGGKRWDYTATGPVGAYYYGAAVLMSHRDVDRVYIGGSGYDGPSVWISDDGGQTLEAWDQGLPPTLVYTLSEVYDGTGRVLAGAENSAYLRDPAGGEWIDVVGTGAPITTYWTSEALADENTVRFGTYGRGIWDLQLDPQGSGCWKTLDADGDGYVCELDCDDDEASTFPGARDGCDGVDSDCDGVAEPDADGDGVLACAGDCDDGDPRAFPGAVEEECDAVDQDCDGLDVCPDAPAPDPAGDKGCGCAAIGGAPWGGLALAGIAAGARRRRRR